MKNIWCEELTIEETEAFSEAMAYIINIVQNQWRKINCSTNALEQLSIFVRKIYDSISLPTVNSGWLSYINVKYDVIFIISAGGIFINQSLTRSYEGKY